jgi:hypothetical protein
MTTHAPQAKRAADLETGPEGLCTSIVTQSPTAGSTNQGGLGVLHGRNLDWNIPDSLKDFVMDLHVTKGGEELYRGTGAIGFVGMLNGMRMKVRHPCVIRRG